MYRSTSSAAVWDRAADSRVYWTGTRFAVIVADPHLGNLVIDEILAVGEQGARGQRARRQKRRTIHCEDVLRQYPPGADLAPVLASGTFNDYGILLRQQQLPRTGRGHVGRKSNIKHGQFMRQ